MKREGKSGGRELMIPFATTNKERRCEITKNDIPEDIDLGTSKPIT